MAVTLQVPNPIGTSSIKLTENDLTGDCYRLNKRFDLQDGVTAKIAKELSSLAAQTNTGSNVSAPEQIVIQGTHAARLASFPATAYVVGSQYIETDRGITYVCRLDTVHGTGINQWWYETGEYFAPNASHPTAVADLTFFDNGFLFTSTDYGHRHIWVGVSLAFIFANADVPGPVVASVVTLPAPAWQPCTGNPAVVINPNCSNGTITTPALNVADIHGNFPMLMGGGAGVKAVAADTFAAGARTDNDSTATQIVQSGTGATVPGEPHTHPISNANAPINPPGETSGPGGTPSGLPFRFGLTFYQRC